jgi:hypothetical protein
LPFQGHFGWSVGYLEVRLGRVINPDGVGKERTRLTRAIVLAIRELMNQTEPNNLTRDLAAFISLALEAVDETIDVSVTAWEKRGYWLKADRFRLEWDWTKIWAGKIRQALLADDWAQVAAAAVRIAEKLQSVKVPQRHRLGTPWVGAWEKLKEKV